MSPRITKPRLIWLPFSIMAVGSWAPVFWMWAHGIEWTGAAGRAVAIWYTVPALVAILLVQGPWLEQPILEPLGLRFRINRWWGIAWLLPVAVLVLASAITWLAGFDPVLTVEQLIANKRTTVPPDQLAEFERYVTESPPPHPWMLIVMGMPAGLTFNLIPGLCEEIAFRGYYFREMPGGFWGRSTRIGILWWLWLAPSIAIGNWYGAPGWWSVALALPWCIVASWVLVYVRVRSESVIAVGIARGTTLALTAAADDLTFGAPAWLAPFYGVSGIAALCLVWLACWAHDQTLAETRLTTT
ncbi:MAG TPA: CPBP family glutamic-type intramembrane protease [Polyangiales bacterium]|nr:CPBP family glutamic-type intramembrane protease [Polyangiales bacterium]